MKFHADRFKPETCLLYADPSRRHWGRPIRHAGPWPSATSWPRRDRFRLCTGHPCASTRRRTRCLSDDEVRPRTYTVLDRAPRAQLSYRRFSRPPLACRLLSVLRMWKRFVRWVRGHHDDVVVTLTRVFPECRHLQTVHRWLDSYRRARRSRRRDCRG